MIAGGSNEIRERVARIEAFIGVVIEVEDDKPLLDKLADLKSEMEGIRKTLVDEASKFHKDHNDLREELAVICRAVGSAAESSEKCAKFKVPEPKCFGGTRSAKELENFLWDMEQYFVAAKVLDSEKVTITNMYLSEDAKLWWRTRLTYDSNAGRSKIDS